jgi:hypothetical protein
MLYACGIERASNFSGEASHVNLESPKSTGGPLGASVMRGFDAESRALSVTSSSDQALPEIQNYYTTFSGDTNGWFTPSKNLNFDGQSITKAGYFMPSLDLSGLPPADHIHYHRELRATAHSEYPYIGPPSTHWWEQPIGTWDWIQDRVRLPINFGPEHGGSNTDRYSPSTHQCEQYTLYLDYFNCHPISTAFVVRLCSWFYISFW